MGAQSGSQPATRGAGPFSQSAAAARRSGRAQHRCCTLSQSSNLENCIIIDISACVYHTCSAWFACLLGCCSRPLATLHASFPADLATALALLHLWGVDSTGDSSLRALLSELQLVRLPQIATASTPQAAAAADLPGIQQQAAALPAVVSDLGVTLAGPTAAAPEHGTSQTKQCGSPARQQGPLPALLQHSPVLVAHRLLAVAALAHRLQAESQPDGAAVRSDIQGCCRPARPRCNVDRGCCSLLYIVTLMLH